MGSITLMIENLTKTFQAEPSYGASYRGWISDQLTQLDAIKNAIHEAQAKQRAERLKRRESRPANERRRRQAGWAITRLRGRVIGRQGYICALCGEWILPGEMSIDHIKPVARGGSDHPRNLQVAHRRCNSAKGARLTLPAVQY